MKKFLLILLASSTGFAAFGQTSRQIDNLVAFAKLYGYVRYFHPSDEAAATDWDRFAIYGAQQVENARDAHDLRQRLEKLFLPIAPSIELYAPDEAKPVFSRFGIKPPDTSGYKVIAWQHLGVGFGNEKNIYRSSRINRPVIYNDFPADGRTENVLEVEQYGGSEFILSARLKLEKGPGTGHLWAGVLTSEGVSFYDDMTDRPVIQSEKWAAYEIKNKIDTNAKEIGFGVFLQGRGKLLVDDLVVKIKKGLEWITVHTDQFDSHYVRKTKVLNSAQNRYRFSINSAASDNGPCLSIAEIPSRERSGEQRQLFDQHAWVGDYAGKPLGAGLSCIVPLALYGMEEFTFPHADKAALARLKEELDAIPAPAITGENLYTRLADLVITWNIFQHFFPYFDVANINWEAGFRKAIIDAYNDHSDYDFLKTLQKFTAPLKDGHVQVYSRAGMQDGFLPPLQWEWIENKLVITHVIDNSLPLQRGDNVTAVNGKSPVMYFEEVHQYISAATKGWLDHRAKISSLCGSENSLIEIIVSKPNRAVEEVGLKRNTPMAEYNKALTQKSVSREISPGFFYLNIDAASDHDIQSLMPKLEKAKGIICDLRGYPKSQPELLTHLLSEKDTSSRWMRVPQIIYPDQENIIGYSYSAMNLAPKEPHLDARIVFITDGSAISYSETYMSFVKHYKLATIVGQPTAGTNGHINPFVLPGGYTVSWTGMRVLKHDGSRHHGVGILPDVYVEKTIEGIRQGRDEFLEKAIEIVSETN